MNVAILASGSGTNAENIINHFSNHPIIKIKCIISNKQDAFVFERAKKLHIPSVFFGKNDFENSGEILKYLSKNNIDFIVLAGFLLKISPEIVANYPNRIINIHPALLPKYGGKGMYGDNVHKAVLADNEKQSGITIHYVNANYDEGAIIFQATCPILETDSYVTLASRIHELEYKFFPEVIKDVIEKQIVG